MTEYDKFIRLKNQLTNIYKLYCQLRAFPYEVFTRKRRTIYYLLNYITLQVKIQYLKGVCINLPEYQILEIIDYRRQNVNKLQFGSIGPKALDY